MSITIRAAVEAQIADKITKGEELAAAVAVAETAAAAFDAAQKNVTAASASRLAGQKRS